VTSFPAKLLAPDTSAPLANKTASQIEKKNIEKANIE
jgi:hypothetical protein